MEIEQSTVRMSQSTKIVASTPRVLESLNYHPLLTDPSCFGNDETNTNIFVHVDDGLMFVKVKVKVKVKVNDVT